VIDVVRRDRDGALQVAHRVVPVGFVHEAATEQHLREEPLKSGQPLHFGMPGAEHMVCSVVVGVDLYGARGLVEDDFRVAHPLLTAFGA